MALDQISGGGTSAAASAPMTCPLPAACVLHGRVADALPLPGWAMRPSAVKKAVADKNPTVVLACLQLLRALLQLDDDQGRKIEVGVGVVRSRCRCM